MYPLTTNHDSDAILVSRARSGDTDAFQILLGRYQLMAFYLAHRLVHEPETAHDLVQEALLQAFLSLHRLRDDAHFKSWLYGIVLNLCRNWLRKHPEQFPSLDLFKESELAGQASRLPQSLRWDPQELLEKRELQRMVHDAVAALSTRNREAAYLFYYEDLGIQEIADRLGITLSAVKNRLHKGREQLRASLQATRADLIATTPMRKRRTQTMIPLYITHTIEHHEAFSDRFIIFFLDEQQRYLFPLYLVENHGPSFSPPDAKTTEPLTLDLVEKVLRALNGKLLEVAIATLWEDLLYAHLTLEGSSGQQTLDARLNDGLLLALRLQCAISVSEEIFERRAVPLADLGTTREQQLDEAARRAQTGSLFVSRKPTNLDFNDGLRGWMLLAHPEEARYALDSNTRFTGKASIALTLLKARDPSALLLLHEGFSADLYRGKRVRLQAYIKAGDIMQPKLTLKVSGPPLDPQPVLPHVRGHGIHLGYLTHAKVRPVEENSDWMMHEMVINVPEDARSISVVLGMEQPGQIWMNGLTFETVASEVPLTGTLVDPPSLTPLNLDFASALEFWEIGGSSPDDYETGLEEASSEQGRFHAYLQSGITEPHGTITLQQRLLPMLYQGKQLRLSAQIKATNIRKQARLFIQAGLLNEERMDEIITGSTDWQRYEVTLPISAQDFFLCFGLTLHGTGQVLIKDIALETIAP